MLKQQINITNQCYLSAADILCNGYESQSSRSFMACLSHAYTCDRDLSCAGNTNDFVTSRRNPTSGRTEIIVTLCQSTCLLFYNACSSWAKIRGYSKAADFCANFTHSDLLAFSDDEDYYGDVVYRVARNDRNCYLGEGIRSGLSIIEAQVGRCIPPLGYVAFLVLLLPAALSSGSLRLAHAEPRHHPRRCLRHRTRTSTTRRYRSGPSTLRQRPCRIRSRHRRS